MSEERKTRSTIPSLEDPPASKRLDVGEGRVEDAAGLSDAIGLDLLGNVKEVMPLEARTAYDINNAIEIAPSVLPMIGTCPFVMKKLVVDELYVEEEELIDWAQRLAEKGVGPLVNFELDNFTLFDTVQQAIEDIQHPYVNSFTNEAEAVRGWGAQQKKPSKAKSPFTNDCTVTIALPALQTALGRDVDGKSTFKLGDFLLPLSKFVEAKQNSTTKVEGPKVEEGELDFSKSLLDALFALGVTSPFGQVSTLKTVVDEKVHKAKQINAENFSVSEAFIAKVEELWAERFYPAKVRAEPYKIKLYNPEGMFRNHKDTPETGLVGTFLVGLTTPASEDVHLTLAVKRSRWMDFTWRSSNGSYCAFYPDVTHCVHAIDQGEEHDPSDPPYPMRGTIAFKIFALPPPQPEAKVNEDAVLALNSAIRPFGILLKHNYTTECHKGLLKGADAALYQALTQLENAKVHVLPVLTNYQFGHGVGDFTRDEDYLSCQVKVYPFTEAMVRSCLAHPEDPLSIPPQWPEHLLNIPFLTAKGWDDRVWALKDDPGAEHTGNESRPAEQHSVYLSAAIIILAE